MQSVLFLCHRLPWPPNKGDKIRSYHVLRWLAEHYRVYLGAFIDDPDDWRHVAAVQALCAGTCIRPLTRWQTRARALRAWTRGEPLTVGCYRDRTLQRWVDQLFAADAVDLVLAYSSGVAPNVLRHRKVPRVMDFVDADSDKWRQYALRARNHIARAVYAREARKLAAFEVAIARQFDAGIFVSAAEARFFQARVPELAARVHGIPNGVDAGYWDPGRVYARPFPDAARALVFAGAMDYRANVDAAEWFADTVWPRIHAEQPRAVLYLVGTSPTPAVRALGQRAGVVVTGRVADVRPYLAHAHAAIAPLRIARGIQNKVLEALAMAKVVLATRTAWEGIDDFEGRAGCISDLPGELAEAALACLATEVPQRVPAARVQMLMHFDWRRNLDAYGGVLRGVLAAPQQGTAHPADALLDTQS